MEKNLLAATGRRKEATARVEIVKGKPGIQINGKQILDYLKRQTLVDHAQAPLVEFELLGTMAIRCKSTGGGLSGQAGAIRLALARVLLRKDPDLKASLRKGGYLTRDAREVERKKYGRPKARKRFQYSKR